MTAYLITNLIKKKKKVNTTALKNKLDQQILY